MLWSVATILVLAQTAPPGFRVESYGGALPKATALACAPDGRIFVAQLDGAVRVIKGGVLLPTPFHTATVDNPPNSDRGLLGLCLDPGFASNGYVYIYYANPSPAPHNCVRRLRAGLGPDVSDGTETVIVDLENLGADTMHMGGGIQFGADGKLYVAVGDNMVATFSQSLTSRFGKILRYNPDGSIPTDNPPTFQGVVGSPAGEFQAIWAIGLRNPFRFAIQPGTGRIFINDVGVDTWEEINDGIAGLNYGWEGGNTDGVRGLAMFSDPIFQYGHRGAAPRGIAITGGTFYNPTLVQFPSAYVGKYFFSDYGSGWIYTINPASPGNATLFLEGATTPVDLQVGADGSLFYLSNNAGVFRVSYTVQSVSSGGTSGESSTGDVDSKKNCGATGCEPIFLILLLGLLKRAR